MADTTKIEWTDATWQIITGCSVVSPGCTNCYAMKLAGTRLKHHPSRKGLTDEAKSGPVWNGQVRFNEQWLDQPLRWKRQRTIFVCAHGDLFHENVPDEWIDKVFAVMALAPQHTFQVLTKRPERMREYLSALGCESDRWERLGDAAAPFVGNDGYSTAGECRWPLPNVWLGVSVEDQKRADERIPLLLDTPAALRFISAEPLLGPMDILQWLRGTCAKCGQRTVAIDKACTHCGCPVGTGPALGWVIAGGESGPGSRIMHPAWYRGLRDQCATANVPFFGKQWGDWAPARPGDPIEAGLWMHANGDTFHPVEGEPFHPAPMSAHLVRIGKKAAGAAIDGREYREMPS